MLKEIKNKIENENLKYKNTIIIGDNSSGKSEVLKELLRDKSTGYYFIDSVNRTFNYKKVSSTNELKEAYKNVLKYRLEGNIFNLVDSFNLYNTGTSVIEEIYLNFHE